LDGGNITCQFTFTAKRLAMPTEIDGFDFEAGSLELYLSFDFLPVEQYASILLAVNTSYRALAPTLGYPYYDRWEYEPEVFYYTLRRFRGRRFPDAPPLTIEDIRTGESIINRLSFDRRLFPSIEPAHEGGLNVHLPRWSAVLALSGVVLAWGQDRYKTSLEIESIKLNNTKTELEIRSLNADWLKDHTDPRTALVDSAVAHFYSEIGRPNIISARINGVSIKADQ
jgi:hypothetical protein